MSSFFVRLDVGGLESLLTLDKRLEEEVHRRAQGLLASVHAHAVELASQKLHTRRQTFVDALSYYEEDGVYVVHLDGSATWIDDGLPEHNMLEDLLKSDKAKTSWDGSTYVVVPFTHSGGPTQTTPQHQLLVAAVREQLGRQKIPYGKIEKDAHGQPLLGKLHSLNLDTPYRPDAGRGYGRGPVGQPMQGWSKDGKSGLHLLSGAQVRQRKALDRTGREHVRREVVTYRVASSRHRGEAGRWDHPGVPAVNIMDLSAEWARSQWEDKIVPEILSSLNP